MRMDTGHWMSSLEQHTKLRRISVQLGRKPTGTWSDRTTLDPAQTSFDAFAHPPNGCSLLAAGSVLEASMASALSIYRESPQPRAEDPARLAVPFQVFPEVVRSGLMAIQLLPVHARAGRLSGHRGLGMAKAKAKAKAEFVTPCRPRCSTPSYSMGALVLTSPGSPQTGANPFPLRVSSDPHGRAEI